jgi:hypothetical protein
MPDMEVMLITPEVKPFLVFDAALRSGMKAAVVKK